MIDPHAHSRRTFTVQQANDLLPLVRAIVADSVSLAHTVSDRSERLSDLFESRWPLVTGCPYAEELLQEVAALERDRLRLQDYTAELLELGVVPKSAIEGLVDFPSVIDGRPVYLCWQLGEPEILYWHELDAGYLGRQPLGTGTWHSEALAAGHSIH